LAIKSKNSAEEIELITSQLTDSANNSVDNMNECVSMVELAVESSESATQNMVEVFTSIEKVNDNVTNVAESATEQAKVSKSISLSTNQLYGLFSTEHAQVEALQQDVLELNQLADELKGQLTNFKFG
jgi:methyl-accepting chemotaxis protein